MHVSSPAQSNTCLQTNSNIGLPFFQGYTGNAGSPSRRIQNQNQAIIPSYKFNCCGKIAAWGVDVNPAQPDATFDLDFQVWRPSPTVNETGCYSLVGNYVVRSTSISVSPESVHVARVTPSPQDQLKFQPGDVLGFYVESHGTTSDFDNGVVLLNNGSHTSELVYFASIDIAAQPSKSVGCPYPVGTNGVLNSTTRAAPVISISTTVYDCSILSTDASTDTSTSSQPGSPMQPTPPAQPSSPSQPNPPLDCGDASDSSTSYPSDSRLSNQAQVEIAVPLVLLFGVVILVGIIAIALLYFQVRKLRKVANQGSDLSLVKNFERSW